MESLTPSNILYIDTESDISTKQPLSIQWRLAGEHGILTGFTRADYTFLRSLWYASDAVMMFNAPYDLGVLSNCFPGLNTWRWIKQVDGGYWDMRLFDHRYRVRRIGGFRNMIHPFGVYATHEGKEYKPKARKPKSTPVIDLLKLWSILVDDGRKGSISLKALIERELRKPAIKYTPQTALTEAYRYQDVDCLEELWEVFLQRTSNIADVQGYSLEQWGFIKTPATFVKIAYENEYPDLKMMQRFNMIQDDKFGLKPGLEEAYHGGITIALHRGTLENTVWYDIHGAYANAIEHLNTDRYLQYHWEVVLPENDEINSLCSPILCRVETAAIMTSINKSLKIFRVKTPKILYMWNYDIQALKLIFPTALFRVLAAYKPIPHTEISEPLPARWSVLKEQEQRTNGKTTLREYYKFMSNTSYGIKAQRNPYITKHTNMAIAGMITARVHYALLKMVVTCQAAGMKWVYSDTDSICMQYTGRLPDNMEEELNAAIHPFTCECEGYGYTTKILSLKRYISEGGSLSPTQKAPDKIKLHGKSRYKITQKTIYDGVIKHIMNDKPVIISQLAANTEISMTQLLNACPFTTEFIHPFAFHTNIPGNKTLREWFHDWLAHIDTKTTFLSGARMDDQFPRGFHLFRTFYQAVKYFGGYLAEDDLEPEDLVGGFTDFDAEVRYLFGAD
ncbi:hypothetical protein ES708_14348 [subsurface metagenome]